jgi:hypothetical protein
MLIAIDIHTQLSPAAVGAPRGTAARGTNRPALMARSAP